VPALDVVINIRYEPESAPGDDTELPSDLRDRLVGLTFTDKARGANECKLTFDNSDLALFDDDRFKIGNKLHVQWGYPWRVGPVREVTIDEIEGFRELQVKGASSRMLEAISLQRTRTFEDTTCSEVAESIAREMGFTSQDSREIETPEIEIRYETISQTSETDLAFLTRLAGDEDFLFRISGGTFHFHPPREGESPTVTLTYFDDLSGVFVSEPKLKQKTTGRGGRTRRTGRDPRGRTGVEGEESNATDTNRDNMGEKVTVRDPVSGQWRETTRERTPSPRAQDDNAATSADSPEEARRNARRANRRAARETVELDCEIVGDAQMSADTTIRIEGIGEKYSGNYLINEMTHNVKGGYTCSLKCKRNAVSRSSAGGAASAADRARQRQQLAAQEAALDRQLAAGEITQAEHTSRVAALRARSERASDTAAGDTGGRRNNAEGPNERELERVTRRDPVTGEFVESYRRRTGSPAAASGEQPRAGGTS
jgi:Bacteriophage probable baseplate hub protein